MAVPGLRPFAPDFSPLLIINTTRRKILTFVVAPPVGSMMDSKMAEWGAVDRWTYKISQLFSQDRKLR
jgi:hypothetical protein